MDAKAKLAEFFAQKPELLAIVCSGYPCHNPNHVEVWEELFHFVFGCKPEDVPNSPENWRPGSTDSLWPKLIRRRDGGYGFGQAMNSFIEQYMLEQPKREAA